jgi:hypothetical protein
MADRGWLIHAAAASAFGGVIVAGHYFGAIDLWPIAVVCSLAFPAREAYQHRSVVRVFTDWGVALEAWPSTVIILGSELVGWWFWPNTH